MSQRLVNVNNFQSHKHTGRNIFMQPRQVLREVLILNVSSTPRTHPQTMHDSPTQTHTLHNSCHCQDLDMHLQALVAFHFHSVSWLHGISNMHEHTLVTLICDPVNSC